MRINVIGYIFLVIILTLPLTATSQVVDVPDPNLRAAIVSALGIAPGDTITAVQQMATLTVLYAHDSNISNLTGLEYATNLTTLDLGYNAIKELSPLVANTGLGEGDQINVRGNPLNYASIYTHIPAIQERGVEVRFDLQTARSIRIVSGDGQEGWPGFWLAEPFVVEVRDESDSPLSAIEVRFTVISGGGTLSVTSATTDSKGRAESMLTLGPDPGANSVVVSVSGIQENQTFTAVDMQTPLAF